MSTPSTPKLAKTEDKPADADLATDENSDDVEAILSNWEIIERIPTPEEVLDLLRLLKPQWGVEPADYLEYIVPLPSKKKVKVNVERDGRTVQADVFKEVYTLYMSVSGRIAMLNAAAELNGWRVDLEPAGGDPSLPPGFIELGKTENEHIVYREQCVIFARMDDGTQDPVGVKTGTAWVKARGGQQAAGSNPYEKVETAARGRAIAGWGIGVLPGSGVASLDEMRNRPREYEDARKARTVPRQSRDDLIARAQQAAEAVRLLRDESDEWLVAQIADYATKKFTIDVVRPATDEEPAGILWGTFKDGQLTLLIADLEQRRKKLAAETDEDF